MGSKILVQRGSLVVVELPPTETHEQYGRRPCMVVSSEGAVANAKYDMLVVVPHSSIQLSGVLYPTIRKGDAKLKRDSVALIDQIRSIDKKRVQKAGEKFSSEAVALVDMGIQHLLGYDKGE